MSGTPRKLRFRFSLFNTLCLLTALAALLGVQRSRVRNQELAQRNAWLLQKVYVLERRNGQLREELGVITVSDPGLFHAMQLETDSQLQWAWRVFVPEDARLRITTSHESLTSEGSEQMGLIDTGQQTLYFSIEKNPNGEGWRAGIRRRGGRSYRSIEPVGEWKSRSTRTETFFGNTAKAAPTDKPIELFKVRITRDHDDEAERELEYFEYKLVLEPDA